MGISNKILKCGAAVFICLISFGLFSGTAQADKLLTGAQACTRHLPKAERYHNIPTHWLAAIATTESGRYHKRIGLSVPWPWTINVEGKGYYFDTKQEAINKIRYYKSKGVRSIDVGCMQVNLRYHGHAFSSIDQALDPQYNIAYAARFLRNNFDEMRSWRKATSAYHSRTPSRGKKYYNIVFGKWEKVIAKLGKTADGSTIRAEHQPSRQFAALQEANVKRSRDKTNRAIGFQVNPKLAKAERPQMKIIKMSDKNPATPVFRMNETSEVEKSRENGVLVIRPDQNVSIAPLTKAKKVVF